MTNNLDLYKEYIKTMSPDFPQSNKNHTNDKFYVIELMRRGKDNPDLPAANIHFKNYYIYCWDDFDKFMPEIIEICTIMRMRAYASVNWKSTKQIAMNTIASMATRAAQGDFKKIYAEWNSQTGLFSQRNENVWLLDLDDCNMNSHEVSELCRVINNCRSQFDMNCITLLPTRSGCHLLTHPFDMKQFADDVWKNDVAMSCLKEFNEKYMQPDKIRFGEGYVEYTILNWANNEFIHKNHVTLLYENL